METTNLVLPVDSEKLASFIFSLLGQQRTIERVFPISGLRITHAQLINLVHIIGQRIAQNSSKLVTMKCMIVFEGGRSVTVYDQHSFETFTDLSEETTVGVDLKLTYLVQFPGVATPEKQDIQIRAFVRGDYEIEYYNPRLLFEIETTNLTWGEDLSNHLTKALRHFVVEDWLLKISELTSGLGYWIFVISAMLLFTIGSSDIAVGASDRLSNLTGLELISAKLDILIESRENLFLWDTVSQLFHAVLHDGRSCGVLLAMGVGSVCLALIDTVWSVWSNSMQQAFRG